MEFKGIKRNNWAENWDAAIPLGNGTIGCLQFGNPNKEKIATTHEGLYLPTPENAEDRPFRGKDYVENARKLIHEGKPLEATKYYINSLSNDGYIPDTMIWTDPFETATEIHIDYEDAEITDYVQKLDFATGEAVVAYKADGVAFERRSFVSRSRNVFVLQTKRTDGKKFSQDIYFGENPEAKLINPVNYKIEEDFLIAECTHTEAESGYVSCARIITDAKTFSPYSSQKGFYVGDCTYFVILYSLTPWKLRMVAERVKLMRALREIPDDYDELLREHEAIHRELFERVSVSFSDREEEFTNDELIAMCTEEALAPEFMERMVDYGRYLEISSFGKLPPNLQGVWNGTVNPPWSSDYTLDENIQMMMWQCLPGGFSEFVRNYFDWLESFTDDFRVNAESYYGCGGIFSAPRVSSSGMLRHFGLPWPMVFWTAGCGWLSQVYQDYYEYTQDENILLRGVKYWKEVVAFYEDFMQIGPDGKYEFCPSYSPENTPLGNDSPTAINSTMDVAIAREVYTNLINGCKILDIEAENITRWEKEFSMLPDYAVNEDGALKEWIPAQYKDDYHHRHSSHLYVVFPGHEALNKGNDDLLKACHVATKYRLIDGVDAISGWGLAHLANISARLKDDELWYRALNRLIQKFTLPNLFTGHNEHSLFQMDANCGITAAAYEMMVYSDNEKIELFPIISEHFPYVCVKGLRARCNIRIELLEHDSEWLRAIINNHGKKDMRIICPKGYSLDNGDRELIIHPGETLNINGYRREQ